MSAAWKRRVEPGDLIPFNLLKRYDPIPRDESLGRYREAIQSSQDNQNGQAPWHNTKTHFSKGQMHTQDATSFISLRVRNVAEEETFGGLPGLLWEGVVSGL